MDLLFILHVILFGFFPILLGYFREDIRLHLLYTYFGVILLISNFLADIYSLQISSTISVRVGTIPFAALFMTAIMMFILKRDIRVIRNLIILIILADFLIFCQFSLSKWALTDPNIINNGKVSFELFDLGIFLIIGGVVLDILDLLIILAALERMREIIKNKFLIFIVYSFIYLIVLCFDGIFFNLLMNLIYPSINLGLLDGLVAKIILGALFCIPLSIFFFTHPQEINKYLHAKASLTELRKTSKKKLINEIERQRQNIQEIEIRSQKLQSIGVLAGGIAHDFNNFLAIISGNISLLQDNLEDMIDFQKMSNTEILSECKQIMQNLQDTVIKGKNLSDQLLMFAKLKKPNRISLDIISLMEKAASLALSGKNVSFEIQTPLKECIWSLDEQQIYQVLINIILNAAQSMLTGGLIEIYIDTGKIEEILKENFKIPPEISNKTYLAIIVKDKGMGIPKKNLSQIFDPFFTTKSNGKGLGLTVCHTIIENHNGFMHIESDVGKGTKIGIFLPKKKGAKSKKLEDNKFLEKIKGLNILIMDDNQDLLYTLQLMLEKMEHVVTSTKNGEECIKTYEQSLKNNQPFDLILMDLIIKEGMGGEEAISHLKQINKNVIVVVIRGYNKSDIITNPKKHGFNSSIEKPFTKEKLEKKISEIFSK